MSDFFWVGNQRMSGPMATERLTDLEAKAAEDRKYMDDAKARIAELEAELEIRDRISLEWIRKGEQAEAELAKLKSGLLDNATFRRRGNP